MEFLSKILRGIFKASGVMAVPKNITNKKTQLTLFLSYSDPVPDQTIQGGGDECKENAGAGLNIVATVTIPVRHDTDPLLEAAIHFNGKSQDSGFVPQVWCRENKKDLLAPLESSLRAEYGMADDAGSNVRKLPVWRSEHNINPKHCFILVKDVTPDPNLPLPSVKSIGVNLDMYSFTTKLRCRPTTFLLGPPELADITEGGSVATFKGIPGLDHGVSVICGPTLSSGKHIFKMRIDQCPYDSELWLGFVSAEGRFSIEDPRASVGNTGQGANAFIRAGYGMRCGMGWMSKDGTKQDKKTSQDGNENLSLDGICCGAGGKVFKSERNSPFGVMPEMSVIEGLVDLGARTISYRTPNTDGKFKVAFENIRKGPYRPCVSGYAKGPADSNGNRSPVIVRVVT